MPDRDTVIELARKAGFSHPAIEDKTDYFMLHRFAALVAAQEREQCAMVCEDTTEYGALDEHGETKAYSSAAAIRARKEET